jgi:membrane-bound lytic murein transglycosylase B
MLAIIARSMFVLGLACACPALAHAAQCGQAPGGFDAWLASFKQEAAAQGISQRAIAAGV